MAVLASTVSLIVKEEEVRMTGREKVRWITGTHAHFSGYQTNMHILMCRYTRTYMYTKSMEHTHTHPCIHTSWEHMTTNSHLC